VPRLREGVKLAREVALPAGAEIVTRPFQLVTGRVWKGTAFGGARGRTDALKIVDWYIGGKIEIGPMITHTMPLPDINRGFDLMHEGKSIRSVVVYWARHRHRDPPDDPMPRRPISRRCMRCARTSMRPASSEATVHLAARPLTSMRRSSSSLPFLRMIVSGLLRRHMNRH
jgi:hypothetical protein